MSRNTFLQFSKCGDQVNLRPVYVGRMGWDEFSKSTFGANNMNAKYEQNLLTLPLRFLIKETMFSLVKINFLGKK